MIGTWHGKIGYDFFSVPRSFINLQFGKSIFDTQFFHYGPFASKYFYHPILSVLLGSWLSQFSPWISFNLFACISMAIILYSAQMMRVITKQDGKEYLVYGCSLTTYLMLWNAQVQILILLSTTLILCGLIEEKNKNYKKMEEKIFWGIMISLFSKPVILLLLPYLVFLKKCRKPIIHALIVYSIISISCIYIPSMNPQGENILHWENILFKLTYLDDNVEVFSSSWLLFKTGIDSRSSVNISKLFLIICYFPLFFISKINEQNRNRFVIIGCGLATLTYFLCYTVVWEYHYIQLMPIICFLLWGGVIGQRKKILIPIILILLPGFYGFFANSGNQEAIMNLLILNKILKLTGVFILFIVLFFELKSVIKVHNY